MAQSNRSRLWIDPPFQARLLLRVVGYLLLYFFIVWHLGFVIELVRSIATTGPNKPAAAFYVEYFWKQLPMLYALVLVLPLFLYDVVHFSHRVAGPLYRCRNLMREMAQGKPVPEFKARKYDLMRDFFAAFNALIKEWNARVMPPGTTLQPSAVSVEETGEDVDVTTQSPVGTAM